MRPETSELIACPACRKVYRLPPGGLEGVPTSEEQLRRVEAERRRGGGASGGSAGTAAAVFEEHPGGMTFQEFMKNPEFSC